MSVPARALCVDLTIDTSCAAVAERLKRRHSHVANRMRSRSSRRFVAVSGSPSYERQALRRSRFSTITLKTHQYRHSLMRAGLLLSFVLLIKASCALLSMSVMSVRPTMSMSFVSPSSSSSSPSIRHRLSGVGPAVAACGVRGASGCVCRLWLVPCWHVVWCAFVYLCVSCLACHE